MKRFFICLIVLWCFAVPCSSAQVNLDRITTINVNAVAPRDVYESLSRLLGCELVLSPEIRKAVTMHLENVTVRTALTALSENLGCRWSVRENILRVDPAGTGKPGSAQAGDGGKPNPMKKFECKTPSNFRFTDTPLDSITESLGKACDLDIKFDVTDRNRLLTIDLSDKTLFNALHALNEQLGPHRATIIISGTPKTGKMQIIMKEYVKQDNGAGKKPATN